ncbi:MAG: TIGR00282 family metallophosphoesterase [Candidatus Omnitrophica bacterium]|nr:TIGR00282 family metallophosphoesterase [Candidatus Omnitrophota bacterium]
MRMLFLGDLVGKPGRDGIKAYLGKFKKENRVDFTVVNIENAASGSGLTPKLADELLGEGIDVLTSGDHIWKKRDIYDYLMVSSRIIRPLNYPDGSRGRGYTIVESLGGVKVAVINIIGRVFMGTMDCPFVAIKKILPEIKKTTNIILVDFHAEATSEKVAMGWFLDGKVSAVIGTHTHIQTADERVLPNGTAYLTDSGMTGPYDSVIGREKNIIIEHFLTQMPIKFEMASSDVRLCGAMIDIDEKTGKAEAIQRVQIFCKD